MPSLQARGINALIKVFLRRRRWGRDEHELVRRARRRLGAPKIFQWYKTLGLEVRTIKENGVWGEWLTPPGAGAAAAEDGTIFYIHGGGYVSCSASTHRPITSTLARLSRFPVFSLNYRRAPEYRYPSALDDAVAAYRWLLGRGVEPCKIALAGDSAGGGLVLGTLLRARDAGLPLPACAVLFSPWTDMTGESETVRSNDGRCALFRPENIEEFGKAYLGDAPADEPYVSLVFADLGGLPPMLLQVGSTELLLDDSRRVHEKILASGGSSRLEVFGDVPHCWQMFDGIVPEARIALRQAADFFREHTLKKSTGDGWTDRNE